MACTFSEHSLLPVLPSGQQQIQWEFTVASFAFRSVLVKTEKTCQLQQTQDSVSSEGEGIQTWDSLQAQRDRDLFKHGTNHKQCSRRYSNIEQPTNCEWDETQIWDSLQMQRKINSNTGQPISCERGGLQMWDSLQAQGEKDQFKQGTDYKQWQREKSNMGQPISCERWLQTWDRLQAQRENTRFKHGTDHKNREITDSKTGQPASTKREDWFKNETVFKHRDRWTASNMGQTMNTERELIQPTMRQNRCKTFHSVGQTISRQKRCKLHNHWDNQQWDKRDANITIIRAIHNKIEKTQTSQPLGLSIMRRDANFTTIQTVDNEREEMQTSQLLGQSTNSVRDKRVANRTSNLERSLQNRKQTL